MCCKGNPSLVGIRCSSLELGIEEYFQLRQGIGMLASELGELMLVQCMLEVLGKQEHRQVLERKLVLERKQGLERKLEPGKLEPGQVGPGGRQVQRIVQRL